MDANTDLWDEYGPLLANVSHYIRLMDKLIYLIITKPDITYVVELVSQFITNLERFIER